MNDYTNNSNHKDQVMQDQLKELNLEFQQAYKKHIPVELNRLKQAYKENNIQSIQFTAHKLAPAIEMMGHKETADLLKKISHDDYSHNHNSMIEQAINEIEQAIAKLE